MDEYIRERLFSLKDEGYKNFHSRLMPDIETERIIGVRVPEIRHLAKELIKEGRHIEFTEHLPHYYYEENNLHAFIVSEIKDIDILLRETERFLPCIDNWATCDSFRPKAFYNNRERLLPHAFRWMKSEEEFTVRFGIEVMMNCFLGEYFKKEYAEIIAGINSDKYYVQMMIAWYFATALCKNKEEILPFINKETLPEPVYSMTVRKIRDSRQLDSNIIKI